MNHKLDNEDLSSVKKKQKNNINEVITCRHTKAVTPQMHSSISSFQEALQHNLGLKLSNENECSYQHNPKILTTNYSLSLIFILQQINFKIKLKNIFSIDNVDMNFPSLDLYCLFF